MSGPFVHNIDPIIGHVGGVYLWWYGASYTFGFIGAFLWIRRVRASLGLDMHAVYALNIVLASGVLVGGRVVEVIFYEWPYYSAHAWHIPAIWLGGMSTHGILLGAVIGTWLFCRRANKSFLAVADVLAIAGAYIMGLGRIGNFIDGQIAGSVTGVWWAVKFPDLAGFRHPVVLYDGLKNLMLVPLLLFIRSYRPPRGVVFGHFVLWYGFLRIFVDFLREYRTDFFGLPPGQEFNVLMSFVGLSLILWAYKRRKPQEGEPAVTPARRRSKTGDSLWLQRGAFITLLLIPLVIPSDWTQDIPERYGTRHAGLAYSLLYPRIPAPTEAK